MLKKWWSTFCGFFAFFGVLFPTLAKAEYTPLLTSTMFDGPKGDVLTAANGMLAVVFIVLGLGLIISVLTHK